MKHGPRLLLALGACLGAVSPLLAQTDDTIGNSLAARRAVPSSLSPEERNRYREIFAAIRTSDWAGAAARLDASGDGPLHSIARAELYLAKGSPKVELEPLLSLLARAPEIPQAVQIARLAELRGAANLPQLPQAQRLIWMAGQPRRTRAKNVGDDAMAAELEKLVQPLIKENRPAEAEALLVEKEYMLRADALTEFRQRIGWSYYIVGDNANALRLAAKARTGIGEWALHAEWLSGLAAWRSGDCRAAAGSFAAVAARATDSELSAAGHYWNARSNLKCGRPELVQPALRMGARMNETFYGLLAQSALGIKPANPNAFRNLAGPDWRAIAHRHNVKAAIALNEIGERELAGELIKHQCKISPADHHPLIQLASDLNLASTQLWLAHNVPRGGRVAMAARYPQPNWMPSRGWRVDPSLVFAHALQESNFRTEVVSPAGAVGLMQVRPGTAGDIARKRGESFDPRRLTDPGANMEFGQSYLEYLREHGATSGLLPKVIAAYNAGPLPVSQWNARAFDNGDPLLYIESIPYWETRGYVPIILRNYWIYEQAKGKGDSQSRKALAQGLWPRFPGLRGAPAVRIAPRGPAASFGGAN